MKVYIEWEHGDADMDVVKSYDIKDIHKFLDFIFDMRGWISNGGWENLGYFDDGHYQRINEHVEKVNKKYNDQFTDIVETDIKFDSYRPAIDKIWLKDGNKEKYIVWTKCLQENKIVLPTLGEELITTTGNISGHGAIFGLSPKKYLYYNDFKDLGKPKGNGTKGSQYPKINTIVKDIRIDFSDIKKYKREFPYFHYTLLLQHERGLITTQLRGYDESFVIENDRLFFH